MIPIIHETGTILINVNYRLSTIPFFWALSRRHGRWGFQRVHCLPEPSSWKTTLKYALDPRLFGIRDADFAICAGTVAERYPLIGPSTTILRTCAPDVFRLHEVKPNPPYRQPYAVFLDEEIAPPHRDYEILGRRPPDAHIYRQEMDQLLKEMVDVIHMPIITAFQARQETPNLVYHSSYVLAHSSTAVSFAVLWNKPLEILIPLCLRGRPEGRNAQAMKTALAKGYQDYTTLYIGTPEAMKHPLTPQELLIQAGYA